MDMDGNRVDKVLVSRGTALTMPILDDGPDYTNGDDD